MILMGCFIALAFSRTWTLRMQSRAFVGYTKAVLREGNKGRVPPPLLPEKTCIPFRDSFVVLGIETSCDDTAAAIVRSDGEILGMSKASQEAIHAKFGGVVPGLARDAHVSAIDTVIEKAMNEASLPSFRDIDAVAVTIGPGLEICLHVGFTKAKDIAASYSKPIVGIHHLEAHCLMSRWPGVLSKEGRDIDFPFLALLVSGGHSQFLMVEGVGQYGIIGGTLDDAVGEAFDKTARMLGYPMEGGIKIEELARRGDERRIGLPIPMQSKKNVNLSFAGLKNAVRLQIENLKDYEGRLQEKDQCDIAAAFQRSAFLHLQERLDLVLNWTLKTKKYDISQLVVVGGVASNLKLRQMMEETCRSHGIHLVAPPPQYCTDNGVMVAWAAIERLRLGLVDDIDTMDVFPRWPLGKEIADEELRERGMRRRARRKGGKQGVEKVSRPVED